MSPERTDTPLLDDTPTQVPDRELPDPQLKRYQIVKEVGRGGMGRVLAVRDQDLMRDVAIKIMRYLSPLERERFTVEARITGQLDHPGVLPVYDYGTDELGNPFFTMKLIREHTSLVDVIDGLRAADPAYADWTFKKRVQVVQKVCQALRYAHERGVIHRDLKPANVVVGSFGEVYLVDWGVAKLLAKEQGTAGASDCGPVEVNASEALRDDDGKFIVGTPAWMAPEHISTGETNERTDLFSLCALLYELLTLNHYLRDPLQSPGKLCEMITQDLVRPAESYTNEPHGRVPRSLSRICGRGLEKEPQARFQSATELEQALQMWVEGKSPMVCPGTCMQRGLVSWSDRIDQRPVLFPAVVILLGSALLGWLIYATWVVLTV